MLIMIQKPLGNMEEFVSNTLYLSSQSAKACLISCYENSKVLDLPEMTVRKLKTCYYIINYMGVRLRVIYPVFS